MSKTVNLHELSKAESELTSQWPLQSTHRWLAWEICMVFSTTTHGELVCADSEAFTMGVIVVLVEPAGLQPDGRYFIQDEMVVLINCLPSVSSQVVLITDDAKESKGSPLLKGDGGTSDGICC